MNLADFDHLWRSIYRELAANGLQKKIYAAGISDGTLTTYCGIYAKELLTSELRSEAETQITSRVHNVALAQSGTMEQFAQCLSRAFASHPSQEAA